jgi:hypothetical protein
MRLCLALVVTVVQLGVVPTAGFSEVSPEDGFAPLFNGRDLGGFRVVVKDRGVVEAQELFVVRDGAIHVYPTQADGSTQPFAGLVTRAEYSHYHLTLEYKWGARQFVPRADTVRDAGVLFHVHGDDIIWPDSVECQIQEGDTGDLWAVRTQSCVRQVLQKGVGGWSGWWVKEDFWDGVQGKGRQPFPRPGWVQAALLVGAGFLSCSRRGSMLR